MRAVVANLTLPFFLLHLQAIQSSKALLTSSQMMYRIPLMIER